MEFLKLLFLITVFMVVIKSLHSISTIPCETPLLENGNFTIKVNGRFILYSCAPTYTMIGSVYSTCLNGQWKDPVPICIKPGCPFVGPPKHGSIIRKNNGASTMLFCNPDYSLAGSPEAFCNGTVWDRSIGSCRKTQTGHATSCDFEESSICYWFSDYSNDFKWTRKNGYTSVKHLQTGPAHDHTIGIPLEGHFMLATLVNTFSTANASLISPLYPANASKNACFSFYYHMFGATTGVLRVYVKPVSVAIADIYSESKYLFFDISGSFPNAWLEAVFNISQYNEDFQIIIEASSNHTTLSDIAIDDVALLNGADCRYEETKSTVVIPEEGDIFDAQSCADRCQETASYSPKATAEIERSSNRTVTLLRCDCFDGCADLKSCCLDYLSVCVFGASTAESRYSTSTPTKITSTPLSTSTTIVSTSSTTLSSKSSTTLKATATPTTKYVTPTVSNLIPSRTSRKTTLSIITTSTLPVKTTKDTSTTTSSIPVTIEPKNRVTLTLPAITTEDTSTTTSSIQVAIEPKNEVTSKLPVITTEDTSADTSSIPVTIEPKNKTDNEKLPFKDGSSTDSLTKESKILLIVFGILLMIVLIVAISIITFKLFNKYRKHTYICNRYSKGWYENTCEEVRFLTPDDMSTM